MIRLLLLTPFLAACVHTPLPCDVQWPRTCEERGDAVQAVDAKPQPERPADPKDDHSRDDNGGSSDGNSDDENGGKSDD